MVLEWWNDIVRWFNSDDGQAVFVGAIVPFVAILLGGLVAGAIARGSTKRLIDQRDREHKASAIAALIASGRRAASWSTLSAQEKEHVDNQASQAEVAIRLLPLSGSALAADWAAHQLATMKKNSVNYSFQAEQDLVDFQDGLIAWQNRPGLAKKLFAQDLAAWKYDSAVPEDELVTKQREWAAAQADADSSRQQTAAI